MAHDINGIMNIFLCIRQIHTLVFLAQNDYMQDGARPSNASQKVTEKDETGLLLVFSFSDKDVPIEAVEFNFVVCLVVFQFQKVSFFP